jgi:Ecdysteroid kinase-like family
MDPMPVWIDDCHLDPAWIRWHTQLACTKCTVEDISNATRRGERIRDGATLKLTVELEDSNDDKKLIIKQVPTKGRPISQQLGLAREALFYNQLANQVEQASSSQSKNHKIIPWIWYAHGDMTSGAKVVIMEDLSQTHVDSGVFFGPGNPNNWKRDLPKMVARAGPNIPSAAHVAKVTFVELAQVHATFWCRQDLLKDDYDWMRGHAWLQGKGKDTWEASQGLLRRFWGHYLEREKDASKPTLSWDTTVRAAVEKSIQGISWEAQVKRLHKNGRWCAVHGDCWPGNFMWMINSQETQMLKLLDWEMVGIGSGPQELGQYVLSNMDPVERRDCEKDLIQAYFAELKRCGVTNVDWDYCWSEYKLGGLERWLWFLIYFAGQEGMLEWSQFFHNQIAAFMKDHGITAADVVQPRP